jgi:tetratricopeptide (TPR) repeat protein
LRLNKTIISIVGIALFLRLFHFYQLKINNPIFDIPIVDSAEYVKVAEYILDKNFFGLPNSYYHPPFYYYFVALIMKIFNRSIDGIRIVQIFLDIVNLLMIYSIGRRIFNNSVANVGAFFYAIYIPMIQANSEILPPILIIFLLLTSIYTLLRFCESIKKDKSVTLWLVISGITYGLLIITLTNFFILLPFLIVWLYNKTNKVKRLKYTLIFLILSLTPAFLSTMRNFIHSNEPVIICYNGGINFYIGNNSDIKRTVSIQPGYQWDSLMTTPYITERITNFGEMQNFWYRKALQFIFHNPLKWMGITLKKAILFFNAWEFPRNTDDEFFNNYSIFNKIPFLKANLLFPLGFSGLILIVLLFKSFKQKEYLYLILLLFSGYAITIILVFITSRYRLPLIPLLCISGGYFVIRLKDYITHKKTSYLFGSFAILFFMILFTEIKFFKNDYPYKKPKSLSYIQISRALLESNRLAEAKNYLNLGFQMPADELTYELYYIRGLYYNKINRIKDALEDFKNAIDLNPHFYYSYNQLGYIYKKIGQVDSGIYYLKKGIEIPHADGMVYFNLADCYLIKNDLDNAIGVFKLYLERKPSPNPVIYEGLAKLYIKKQDYTNAIENFKWAIRYPQGYEIPPEIFNLIGICYFKTGDLRNAKIYWQMGLKKDKKYLPIIQNLKLLNK